MISLRPIDLDDPGVAARVLVLQRAAYRVEAELIGDDRIPPLHEPIEELVAADETWVGAFVEDELAGAVSYRIVERELDIHRLVVDPAFFRRRLGRQLVAHLHELPDVDRFIVSTGAANVAARNLYERLGYVNTGEVEVVPGLWIATYARSSLGR